MESRLYPGEYLDDDDDDFDFVIPSRPPEMGEDGYEEYWDDMEPDHYSDNDFRPY